MLAHPRLVATTITLGLNRVERKMPEKRPARKLTQRVVVREAAWRRLSHWFCQFDTNHKPMEAGWMVLLLFGRNLLGSEVVRTAKAKCEALALKDALDAAREAEEEEGEEENQVWVFHLLATFNF